MAPTFGPNRSLGMRPVVLAPFVFLTAAGVRKALYWRFQPSKIQIQSPVHEGAVTRRGRLLVLSLDGVPAKPRWLEWTLAERICSPGISQLCIEP